MNSIIEQMLRQHETETLTDKKNGIKEANVIKIVTKESRGKMPVIREKVTGIFITNITQKGVDKRAKKCGEALRDVETRRERCRWTNTHTKSSRS